MSDSQATRVTTRSSFSRRVSEIVGEREWEGGVNSWKRDHKKSCLAGGKERAGLSCFHSVARCEVLNARDQGGGVYFCHWPLSPRSFVVMRGRS